MRDERRAEILIRPGSTDGRSDIRVVPQTSAAVHVTSEHSRNVGSRSNRPRQQVLVVIRCQCRDHMERIFGSDFSIEQIAQLAESQDFQEETDKHQHHP